MNNREFIYIEKCLQSIEEKLNWGPSEYWKQRDFEALSDLIYAKTKTQLSLSTLKRVWQKSFKQLPQSGTLNALVQFLDYHNWQDFKSKNILLENKLTESKRVRFKKNSKKKRNSFILIIALAGFIIAFIWLSQNTRSTKTENENFDPDQIEFVPKSISDNIPNTVIFNYKLGDISTDSLFIQQSWDKRRRRKISIDDSVHTSIYYYPGYFNTKLLIGDSIVKEHPLHITTNDWQALATETGMDEIPSYIPDDVTRSEGALYVSPETLKEYNVDLKEISHWVHFFNSRKFGELDCNNFILETAVKNSMEDGALTCQEAYIQVHFEKGFSMFPLAIPGCISNLRLAYNDYRESGKRNDLSMFGCDMDEWQKLKIVANNGKVDVYLNDQPVKSFTFRHNSGKITYLQYRFKGCGKVDYVVLKDTTGVLVYSEHF